MENGMAFCSRQLSDKSYNNLNGVVIIFGRFVFFRMFNSSVVFRS